MQTSFCTLAHRAGPCCRVAVRQEPRHRKGFAASFLKPVSAPHNHDHIASNLRVPQTDRDVSSAASAAAGLEGTEAPKSNVRLVIYLFLWYAFNVIFNIINKSTLNAFPMPWFIATWQLMASGLFMAFLWITKLQPLPVLAPGFIKALLPVAFFHTIGHVAAVVSFSKMAVSFTHVIKASEPVFTVALSGLLVGTTYPVSVWLSLIPIVAGCSLSSIKEVTFGWAGFNSAMASNLGMVLRGIYSKQSLDNYKDMDGINLFGLISISSLVYCLPAALILERHLWPQAIDAAVVSLGSTTALAQYLIVGGIFYHLYNQLSYMVLNQGVSPVSFSVGNTMKRVAVVVASVAFFKNPVSPMNWLGSALAILGTYLYSLASMKKKKS